MCLIKIFLQQQEQEDFIFFFLSALNRISKKGLVHQQLIILGYFSFIE